MLKSLDYLREFNGPSVFLRMILAVFLSGILGLERGKKHRPAGFRTYILVCLGAALTMVISQYELYMFDNYWEELKIHIGIQTDAVRFGAQVINGIGFLGAGTVILGGKQEIKGLTTAAGLWASACMGLAVGAGFYECAGVAFILILLVVLILPIVENFIIEHARNISIYIEFESLDDISRIINEIKMQDVIIYEIDINKENKEFYAKPSAVFLVRLKKKQTHAELFVALSEVESICILEEIC